MEQKKLTKLLIVDDDEDILTISKISINSIIPEIAIFCVKSGEEAVLATLDQHPDLILLDIMMPLMDGVATLKAIRLIPSVANIPIVFFTARVSPKGVDEYLKYGAIDIIIKPFDPIELPNIIRNIWDKYQSTLRQ